MNGTLRPASVYVLTFSGSRLPEAVTIGWLRCPVRLCVPLPRRCFKCQKFGHGATRCRALSSTCGFCSAQPSHEHPCPCDAKCANCDGPHPAFSKNCFYYNFEKEVLQIQARDRTSYIEAKKSVRARYLHEGVTYADRARHDTVQLCPPLESTQSSPLRSNTHSMSTPSYLFYFFPGDTYCSNTKYRFIPSSPFLSGLPPCWE